jgi:hypothetical protein
VERKRERERETETDRQCERERQRQRLRERLRERVTEREILLRKSRCINEGAVLYRETERDILCLMPYDDVSTRERYLTERQRERAYALCLMAMYQRRSGTLL